MGALKLLAVIGLFLDMIGVIFIFFFGIPPRLDIEGNTYIITEEKDKDEIRLAKRYKIFSYFGLIFVFTGFLMQLLSYLLK
jgi:hypothetical protein